MEGKKSLELARVKNGLCLLSNMPTFLSFMIIIIYCYKK